MREFPHISFATEANARQIAQTFEEPGWLLDERLDAVRRFEELPGETNALFTTYLDLRMARFGEILPYAETGDAPDAGAAALPPGAAGLIHVSEDTVVARVLSPEAAEAGVVVDTFANVLRERPDLLRPIIEGGSTLPTDDKFAQLARAVSAVGVLVFVPAGVRIDAPIVVRWSAGSPGRGVISRTVVALGEGSHASVLEEQVASEASNGVQGLWWGTMEVRLAAGASLDVAGQQDLAPETIAFVNRHATLGEDASLRWALATIGGALHKSRIDNVLEGRGSSVRQVEIGFGAGSQFFDLTSYTRHVGQDTTGDLLSKGVFFDRARGYFKGMIQIQKTARGTDSYLGEFAMLLTKKARSVAIPSLEIDQPDVRRASHSSSVGPIDEAQIFYLMSRGLDRETARKFIVLGFLEPVVARIPLGEVQDRLRDLLERKWPSPESAQAA